MNEFILIESDSNTAESFDSREELALALIKRLLEDDELHVFAERDDDGTIIVEVM